MSKNIFKQKNLYYFLIPFVFFCIFSLISITLAQQGSTIWQEPTATPPNGNVSAPLNVGNVTQTKTGGLNIYGNAEIRSRLYVKGHVGTNAELTLQKGGTNPNNLNYPQFSFMATEDTLRLITRVYSFNNMGGLRIAVTNATTIGVVNINGNVGIGTTNPTAKLEVAGNIKIADGTQGSNKVLTSDANGLASWKSLSDILSTTNIAQLTVGKICLGSSSCIENWNDITNQTGTNYWTLSGNNLYPTSTSYNVGIGTNNPSAKLEVNGQIRIKSNENNDNYGYIEFDSDSKLNIGLKGKEFHKYDLNKNYVIESNELDVAKEDFNKGKITFRQLLRIIQLYNLGSYNNIALTDPYDIKEVGGIININNSQIRITGGNPGLNKVLTSDANGLASWKSLSDILSTTNIAQLTVGKICLGSSSCIENWNDITNQTGTNYWTLSGNNLYPTSTSYSVGIGTSNPSKKLTVFANKASDGLKIIREGGGTGSNAVEKTGLSINMGNLHPWIDYVGGIAFIPIDNYNELGNWQTNPTYSLYLSSKGNVGIGTTKVFSNQDAKFDAQLQIVSSDLDSFADLFLGKKGVNEAFSLRAGGDGNISFHIRKVNFESGVLSNDYFTIISNGNVGIGTNDPSTKLDVVGNIKVSGTSTNAGNITATGIITAKNFCITGSNNCLFSLAETVNNLNTSITNITNIINKGITGSGTENYLAKFGAGGKTIGNSIIYETSTGKVGIGTTSPSKKLTVFANKASDGLKIIREGGGTGSNAVEKTGLSINMGNLHPWIDYVGGIAFIPIDNYNELGNWQTNPTYSLYLSSKGNVGIGTTKVFSNQDAKFDAQLQIVSSDLDSFADLFLGKKGVNEAFSLRAGGDGNISFHIRKVNFESGVLSNDYFTIISNGNVGIGTNDPSTKLDVVGNIKVSGTSTNAGNITATGIITAKNFCITGSNNCLFSLAETVNNLNTSITNITNIINKGITGSGTENYLAKFGAGGKTIGNSIIYETSTGNVGIGTNNPAAKLDVRGIVSTSNGFVVSDGTDTFVSLGNDNNRNLELRSKGGTPYIDFSNDTEKKNNNYTTDFDMRIILTGNDTLEVQGGDLKVSGKVTGTELCIGGDCKKSWPTGGSKTERIICTYSENYFTYFDKNSGTLEIENQCKIKRDTESKDNKNYILGCPSGYRIVSGGPWCDGNKFIRESRPDSLTSWKVSCRESYFSLDISNKTTPNGASIICEK